MATVQEHGEGMTIAKWVTDRIIVTIPPAIAARARFDVLGGYAYIPTPRELFFAILNREGAQE